MKLRMSSSPLWDSLSAYLLMYVGLAPYSRPRRVDGGFAILCLYALGCSLFLEPLGTFCCPIVPERTVGFRSARMVRDSAAEVLPFRSLAERARARAPSYRAFRRPRPCFDDRRCATEMLAQIAYIALAS